MGEGFASPNSADSRCVLEAAVGKILRGTEVDTVRRIVVESGTRLDVAGAWAVMQVELATRTHGRADLDTIAAQRRVPPEVRRGSGGWNSGWSRTSAAHRTQTYEQQSKQSRNAYSPRTTPTTGSRYPSADPIQITSPVSSVDV